MAEAILQAVGMVGLALAVVFYLGLFVGLPTLALLTRHRDPRLP